MENLFTWLPSVEEVLNAQAVKQYTQVSRTYKTEATREVLTNWRLKIKEGPQEIAESFATKDGFKNHIIQEVVEAALVLNRNLLHPVVNGTGIVLHTNLGRAPLALAAQQAVISVIEGYCNLEIDLESGNRSQRYQNVEKLLCDLTGAEACLVVNNNAAALLLALETMAKGKEGVISRGQLVEIGGSFRVPDIMARSGVILHEIGTTNKTKLQDYSNAINQNTGILLLVHPSNFAMTGFVETVALEDISQLGLEQNIPTLYDWGCGAIFPLAHLKIGREQTIKKIISSGVDVVTFSGDKLLGGPQCGIIIGKKVFIEAMKKNHFTRALRVDKLVLAALEGTLRCYSDTVTALQQIPVLHQLTKSEAELKVLAEQLQQEILQRKPQWKIKIKATDGQVGGGSLPDVALPTWVVTIQGEAPVEVLAKEMRTGEPAVLGYINEGCFCLDTRAILATDLPKILLAIQQIP